jgi:hypothetical protein
MFSERQVEELDVPSHSQLVLLHVVLLPKLIGVSASWPRWIKTLKDCRSLGVHTLYTTQSVKKAEDM